MTKNDELELKALQEEAKLMRTALINILEVCQEHKLTTIHTAIERICNEISKAIR